LPVCTYTSSTALSCTTLLRREYLRISKWHRIFLGQMSFLSPNQQCQSTDPSQWSDLVITRLLMKGALLPLQQLCHAITGICIRICWWRWALVSPDGVAPSRMVGMSASVNLPLHHKVQKFSSVTSSPGWSRKRGHNTVVVCW